MQEFEFDRDYVQQLMAGDPAIEAHFISFLYRTLQPRLRLHLRSLQDRNDVRQETFLRVFQSLRRNGIQRPDRLAAFISSVCNNVLFEFFRANKRWLPLPDNWFDLIDETPSAESRLLRKEERLALYSVLADLPQRDREILVSLFFQEESRDEVCLRYGVGREYLRVLLHRAKARLRGKVVMSIPHSKCA